MSNSVDLLLAVPPYLMSEFLGRLHYVSEDLAFFRFDSNRSDRVVFETRIGRETAAEEIAARIRQVARKLCDAATGFNPRVLFVRRPETYWYQENPRAQMESNGDLFEYGPGRFGLGPAAVRLEEYFDNCLLRLADQVNACRYRFPALISADVLHQCRYLRWFPHLLTLTCHLKEDLEAIQRFASGVSVNGGVLNHPPESVAPTTCLLAPTICFHYYTWLRGRQIDVPQTITAAGHCFRYESGNMTALERLWDFRMREIVFVGPQDYVVEKREQCIKLTVQLLAEWELGYEIKSATDPAFVEGYAHQAALSADVEPKFEIRVDLPYATGRTLAVGSFNFHQDFFGRVLGIAGFKGKTAVFTGCVGFGLERLVWAFFSQHGPDPDRWPQMAKAAAAGNRHG